MMFSRRTYHSAIRKKEKLEKLFFYFSSCESRGWESVLSNHCVIQMGDVFDILEILCGV